MIHWHTYLRLQVGMDNMCIYHGVQPLPYAKFPDFSLTNLCFFITNINIALPKIFQQVSFTTGTKILLDIQLFGYPDWYHPSRLVEADRIHF